MTPREAKKEPTMSNETPTEVLADMNRFPDEFNGDDAKLVACIEALLSLDAKNALVPHGIGGHARGLLSAAMHRLSRSLAAGKVIATVLHPDPEFPSPGPLFSCEDWRRLVELPAGTKLYTAPPADPALHGHEFLKWCAHWFGPDSDETHIANAVRELLKPPADPAKASGCAPEVTEQAIERVALALATSIERDELQAYAYRAHARRAIAALQQEGKSHG